MLGKCFILYHILGDCITYEHISGSRSSVKEIFCFFFHLADFLCMCMTTISDSQNSWYIEQFWKRLNKNKGHVFNSHESPRFTFSPPKTLYNTYYFNAVQV